MDLAGVSIGRDQRTFATCVETDITQLLQCPKMAQTEESKAGDAILRTKKGPLSETLPLCAHFVRTFTSTANAPGKDDAPLWNFKISEGAFGVRWADGYNLMLEPFGDMYLTNMLGGSKTEPRCWPQTNSNIHGWPRKDGQGYMDVANVETLLSSGAQQVTTATPLVRKRLEKGEDTAPYPRKLYDVADKHHFTRNAIKSGPNKTVPVDWMHSDLISTGTSHFERDVPIVDTHVIVQPPRDDGDMYSNFNLNRNHVATYYTIAVPNKSARTWQTLDYHRKIMENYFTGYVSKRGVRWHIQWNVC